MHQKENGEVNDHNELDRQALVSLLPHDIMSHTPLGAVL